MGIARAVTVGLAVLALGVTAHAQRARHTRIVIDPCAGRPNLPLDWVVPMPPGQTGEHATTCPWSTEQARAMSVDAIEACEAPDRQALACANALFDEGTSLDRAYALYRALARAPELRSVALYRAERSALRLGHYADAIAAFADLVGAGPIPTPLRAAAERLVVAGILANADIDDDGVPDPDFPEARFAPSFLPDAPWARPLAVAAVIELVSQTRVSEAERARAAVLARWPDATELATLPSPADASDEEPGGDIDATSVQRAISTDPMRECSPPHGAVLAVTFTIAEDGTPRAVVVTPPGPTATCLQQVFVRAHVPSPTGGSATLSGIILFPTLQ